MPLEMMKFGELTMVFKGLAAAAALLSIAACGGKAAPAAPGVPAVEVSAYTVQPSAVPVSTELPGRTAAFVSAEIRPQVGGIVLKRLFTEGGDVRAGQVLYQIDPSAARATVASAQATLASAQSGLASAREKAARYRELVSIEAVSRESADEAQAAYEQAQAQVNASRAALDTAKLSLGYANVTSPINGRIGRSAVTPGALVTASQTTALATVQQLDPIYVDATHSAAEMLRLRRDFAQGKLKIDGGGRPTARLVLEDGSAYASSGQLLLAEATVSETAGSVTLRAQFPNPKSELLPGMYVRMTLEGAVAQEVLLVPQVAVTRDAKGNALVFVIGDDGKVAQRALQATQAVGDAWIVDSGLKAGERVVVEGVQRLRAGMAVKVASAASAASAAR
jgi:membrane fusion protein, multidrug efflux system